MEIQLNEKPQEVTLIQGLPGFGMVGSIATEFLLEHLETRQIGSVSLKDLPAMIAIHKGKIIPPIGIYYNEKYNIAIINILTKSLAQEWKFADAIKQIASDLKAKEIITLESVAGENESLECLAFSNNKEKTELLKQKGFNILEESIIMGVSAALILKKTDITAFFALTTSTWPDSNAAAEIVKSLDKYMKLEVNYEPLHEQAKEFEDKVKTLLSKSDNAIKDKEKGMMNYMG